MNMQLANCRGQCYHGASNMYGSKNGVATQLAREESRALYLHCFGHALTLAVGDTLKQPKLCQDALEVAVEVTKLIKFFPKRNAMLDKIRADEEQSTNGGIRSFCPTRWTVSGDSIESILNNYSSLRLLWEQCLETKLNPDVKSRIIGVQAQMSLYHIVFGLKLCERVLKITDNLSKMLQAQSLSAVESYRLAQMTITTLVHMRTEQAFDLFFQPLDLFRKKLDLEEPTLPRRRKTPRRFECSDGEPYHSSTVEEHFRQQYFEALDFAVSSISNCFD